MVRVTKTHLVLINQVLSDRWPIRYELIAKEALIFGSDRMG